VKVHDSALKHGVLPEDAVQAADWPLWIETLDEEGNWPHRELRLGFDTQARLLETGHERDVRAEIGDDVSAGQRYRTMTLSYGEHVARAQRDWAAACLAELGAAPGES
jgi:hypothetical protein